MAVTTQTYVITDLGTLPGGDENSAKGINDAGVVVGYSRSGGRRAVLWAFGSISDLGLLPDYRSSEAAAINAAGVVVGWASDPPSVPPWTGHLALRWAGSGMEQLSVPPHCLLSQAYAINDAGQIVGMISSPGDLETYAVLWEGDDFLNLGALPEHISSDDYVEGVAQGINADGIVVGVSRAYRNNSLRSSRAVQWEPASGSGQPIQPGGTTRPLAYRPAVALETLPGGGDTYANAINASGIVVGSAETADSHMHAVRWEGGHIVDLGTLPGTYRSEATAINDDDLVIGSSSVAGISRPVLWNHGDIIDLGDLSEPGNSHASAINNAGQVVGRSATADRKLLAVLWSPAS